MTSAENTAIAHNDWIEWSFKCLNCNYRFTAIEPKEGFEKCKKCVRCSSENIIKKVVKE